MNREIYCLKTVSDLLGEKVSHVETLIEDGRLPAFELPGGHYRIRHEDLSDYLKQAGIVPPEDWKYGKQEPKVLLVEDDPDLLELITELLREQKNIQVRSENNGFTAGLQIAGWSPDLILLDFLMPGISGFEVCRKLRSQDSTRDIPVLALTSLSSSEDKKSIFASGASDYLGKPFHSEDLITKVQTLLGCRIPASEGTPSRRKAG